MIQSIYLIGILSILYLSGLGISGYFTGLNRIFRLISISLPIGIGAWGIIWSLINIILQSVGFHHNEIGTEVSLAVYSLISCYFLFKFFKKQKPDKKVLLKFTASLMILLILSLFFESKNYSVFFGDSFALTAWSYDINALLAQGYPLMNLALANLTALVMPDYYFFAIHPLIALSLSLIIIDSVYQNSLSNENGISFSILLATMLFLLFVTNNTFIWQSIYVNHHSLAAAYILIFAVLSFELNESKKGYIFLAMVLFMFSFTRIEGFIYAILAVMVFCSNKIYNSRSMNNVLKAFIFISSPFVIYLSATLWDGELFSGKKYFAAYVLSILFLVISIKREKLRLKKIFDNLPTVLLSSNIFVLSVLFSLNMEHMQKSILNFFSNGFNTDFWGISNYMIIILMILLFTYQIIVKKIKSKNNLLLYYFVISIALTLSLSYFRMPFRRGWSDSGNRMLFHFLPVAYVWVGYILSEIRQNSKK